MDHCWIQPEWLCAGRIGITNILCYWCQHVYSLSHNCEGGKKTCNTGQSPLWHHKWPLLQMSLLTHTVVRKLVKLCFNDCNLQILVTRSLTNTLFLGFFWHRHFWHQFAKLPWFEVFQIFMTHSSEPALILAVVLWFIASCDCCYWAEATVSSTVRNLTDTADWRGTEGNLKKNSVKRGEVADAPTKEVATTHEKSALAPFQSCAGGKAAQLFCLVETNLSRKSESLLQTFSCMCNTITKRAVFACVSFFSFLAEWLPGLQRFPLTH